MRWRSFLTTAGLTGGTGALAELGRAAVPSRASGSNRNGRAGKRTGTCGPGSFDAALSFPSYVLSMDEQLAEEPRSNQLTPLEDVNERTTAALETAIEDGEYRTDSVDDALLEGLFRLLYVDCDGTIYDVDYELPEYVVSARDVPESAIDPDRTISARDDRIRTLSSDNEATVNAVMAVLDRGGPSADGGARDREYRATILDEHLAAFLEEHDYLAYPGDGDEGPEPEGYVELELEHEDPGPPYTVIVEDVTAEQRYGRPVVDVSEYPCRVAETLRRAADWSPLRADRRPFGIDAALDDDAYVRIDGDVYEPELQTVDHDAVPVSLAVADVDTDERSFTLALEADGESATVSGGVLAPFEVLFAARWRDLEDGGPLWSDVYEESEHVDIEYEDGEPIIWTHSLPASTSLEPGDPVTETYEVRPDWGVDGGLYRAESSLSISWDGGDAAYPYVVWLAVPPLE